MVSAAMIVAAFLLWRANRAHPVEPEEAVSEHAAFGSEPLAFDSEPMAA